MRPFAYKLYVSPLMIKSRVIRCFDSVDPELIDRTIKSMPKRIEQIIAAKGGRIKF